MGLKILCLCLLYETIALSYSGAVTLPFTDLVATVKPIKPKPLTESTGLILAPALPKVPSSDAILAYFKSQFFDTDISDIKCEYSAPLVLSSSSRPVAIPKIEGLNNKDDSRAISCLSNDKLNGFKLPAPIVESLSEASRCNSKRESILTSEVLLPYNSSPALKLGSSFILPVVKKFQPQAYPNIIINDCPPYPYIWNAPMSPLLYSDISGPNTVLSLPSIGSLPIVSLDSRRTSDNFLSIPQCNCLTSVSSTCCPYLSSMTQLSAPVYSPYNKVLSYATMASLNPVYSVPYPLRYNLASLPVVATPNIIPTNIRPAYTGNTYSNTPCPLQICGQQAIDFDPILYENINTPRETPLVSSSRIKDILKALEYILQFQHSKPSNSCDCLNSVPGSLIINTLEPITLADTSARLCPPSVPTNCAKSYKTTANTRASCYHDDVFPFDFVPTDLEFDPSQHAINNFNSDIGYLNDFNIPDFFDAVNAVIKDMDCNLRDDSNNFQTSINVYPQVPEFPEYVPYFNPIQEILTDSIVPQIHLLPLVSDELGLHMLGKLPVVPQVKITHDITQPCLPSSFYPSAPLPSTYVNVSPSYSLSQSTSNAISSVNNLVSDITQNILSSFMAYLISLPKKNSRSANQYVAPKIKHGKMRKYKQVYPLTCPSIITVPVLSQRSNKSTRSNAPSVPEKILMDSLANALSIPIISSPPIANVAAFSDDFPSSSFITYPPVADIMPAQITTNPIAPVKLTMLPPVSFADYSPARPCPSDLPSPFIPSVDISSTLDPQVVKVKNFGKNAKTIERLLELVFLTEMLNGDTYVDWDALDTALALLLADSK